MIGGAMIGGVVTGDAVAGGALTGGALTGGTVTGFVIHALVVSLLLGCAATLAEPLARAARLPTRWVWLSAMLLSVGLVAGGMLGGGMIGSSLLGSRAAELASGGGASALDVRAGALPGQDPAQDLAGDPGWQGLLTMAVSRLGHGVSSALLKASRPLPHPSPALVAGLALLWGAASTLLMGFLVAGALRHARMRRDWPRLRVLGEEARLSPGREPAHGPAVAGLLRPEIILPRWALGLPPADLRLVLRHEAEHRHARDPALLAVASLCLAAVPWNVPLWWQLRRLRDAVEMDCDARVLRSEGRRRPYAELLLRVAAAEPRTSVLPGRTSPSLAFPTLASLSLGGSRSQLERRFLAMRPLAPRPLRLVTAAAAALLLVLAACLADQPLPVEPEATLPVSATASASPLEAPVPPDPAAGPPTAEDIGGPDGIITLERIEVEATRGRAPVARSVGETVRVRMSGPMAGLAASDAEDSPLVVVNGEAWTLSGSEVELNPEDIASIEILKGAAAEARYGARGANGVILITLKEGI